MDGHNTCTNLREFLDAETAVIRKHIARHKWFKHIPDEEQGLQDFIEAYGWIMREMYCGYACPQRFQCSIAALFMPDETLQPQDSEKAHLPDE